MQNTNSQDNTFTNKCLWSQSIQSAQYLQLGLTSTPDTHLDLDEMQMGLEKTISYLKKKKNLMLSKFKKYKNANKLGV